MHACSTHAVRMLQETPHRLRWQVRPVCRYVLWEDGSSVWVNLPKKLHDKLIGRQKSLAGVQAMSIGDNGDWFVRFHNGSWESRGPANLCCEMHVSHAFHMHEPGTDARIWTCDVRWAAHIGAAHICNIVWCICLSNTKQLRMA